MRTAAMLLLLTTTAYAMDEKIFINKQPAPKPITEEEIAGLQPSEENKKWFLERGYKLNYGRMCCGFVDVPSGADDARPIKTERIIPIAKSEDKNEIDETADVDWEARRKFMHRTFKATREQLADVCTRHSMRKVTTSDGRSWHCRK